MKTIVKPFLLPLLVVCAFVVLAIGWPAIADRAVKVTWDYFKEMILILPPVFILMGLIEVWVPKEKIQSWLGRGSGIRGLALSLALGTLPTGPLYVAFPMAASLIQKGAGIANMVLFLGAWAALKIPQLMVEIKFLGLNFAMLRFALTLAALLLIGFVMEKMIRHQPSNEDHA